MLFLLAFSVSGVLSAQKNQIVPPFLKHKPMPQTVKFGGATYTVPDFSIAPTFAPAGGLVIGTPFGFLSTEETAGGLVIGLRRFANTFHPATAFRTAPNPLLVTEGLGRTPNGPVFDFSKSAPHLAFFCRLEINEKKGGIIPAKFRLGGHTNWQTELKKRE